MSTLNKLIHNKHVMIAPRESLEMILMSYPAINFKIAREGFISTVGNYAIRKTLNTKYKNNLSKMFKNLYYFGIEQKIKKLMPLHIYAQLNGIKSLKKITTLKSEDSKYLTNNNHQRTSYVKTFLYIYFIGLTISIFAFICEVIALKRNKNNKFNLNQNNLNFNKIRQIQFGVMYYFVIK